MSNVFFSFLTLVGSLGLFLFGMKLMSESLQKVAGDKMRNILAAMTTNKTTRIITGVLVTAVIQSSSATTVMVVSFVNAGLMSLTQSVGVIMGANIGTTVTAWIISILGFQIDISHIALPLIGISFPLLFSKVHRYKFTGELITGFALLFIGLGYLKDSVPTINDNPQILEFIKNYTNLGLLSTIIFVAIGTLITIIIQSSSATMALTLVMCSNGWISFESAAAMVLGENIGTTITANIAAMVANVSAKRAARSHFIFNVFGVVWVVALFHPFLKFISLILTSTGASSPFFSIASIPIGLSLFHTVFNITNTLFLVNFTGLIVKVVTKMVPAKDDEEENFRLKHLEIGLLSTSELSLLQAKKEIITYARRTNKMFSFVRELFKETNGKNFEKILNRIVKYEEISDRVELEIATYLTQVAEGDLSEEGSRRVHAMLKVISNMESIADSSYNLAKTLDRKRQNNIWFPQELRNNINGIFDKVDDAFVVMVENLEFGYGKISLDKANKIEQQINQSRNMLREEHIQNVESNKYKYLAGVIYNDLFSESEKLADYIINVSEDIFSIKPIPYESKPQNKHIPNE